MNPYYQDEFVTLYHGKCEDIISQLPVHDLLLIDPPYGIDADNQKRILSRGKLAAAKDYGISSWDKKPFSKELMDLCISKGEKQIIWGGNYYQLPPTSCWLLWDKENGDNNFADAEMAWTNLKGAVRLKRHLWNGMLRKDNEVRYHPTQKPLEIIKWCIGITGDDVKTIIDPCCGSGTTGRAAKDLGRKCVMIEQEEKYCEIAANRMLQECFKF